MSETSGCAQRKETSGGFPLFRASCSARLRFMHGAFPGGACTGDVTMDVEAARPGRALASCNGKLEGFDVHGVFDAILPREVSRWE
jgi:hypothetical protein